VTREKRAWWKRLLWVLYIVLGVYGVFVVLLILFQSSLMYHPTRTIDQTPKDAGLYFEEVFIDIDEDVSIHGWFVPADDSGGSILFFHGNGGNISHRIESIAVFNRLGMDVLIVDYEGYGRSEGSVGEKQTYRDAEAAWDHLVSVRKADPERIVIFGRSLGGAIATYLAEQKQPAGLIVESCFTSAPDMASDAFAWLLFARYFCRFKYNSLEKVANIKCPKLFLHSPVDDIVPYRQGERLFEAAAEPKEFFELKGKHNEGFAITEGYEKALGEFLASVQGANRRR
jgi:fermentation-respiration switch protein FrsA (DUF1100 family)